MSGQFINLASGTKVPQVAFGLGALKKQEGSFDQELADKFLLALKNGYRHLDGAAIYRTDLELAWALQKSGIPRSELFITHKTHPTLGIAQKNIENDLLKTLATLKTDYIDLYLIHNPFFPENSLTIEEAWRQMEAAKEKGLVKEIGISNFEPVDIDKVLKIAKIKPAVNQVELHPYNFKESQALIAKCRENSIVVGGYSPLMPIARGSDAVTGAKLTSDLDDLAKKYNVTPAQILVKWLLQKGIIVATTSANSERQKKQLDLDFHLDESEEKLIAAEGAKHPHRFFGWGGFKQEYKSVL